MIDGRLPRLIVSDLDGTLLLPDRRISQRSRDAITAARAQGIVVGIATARPPRTATQFARMAGIGGVAICANGAIIHDLDRDETIEQITLDRDVAIETVVRLRRSIPGVCFACLLNDGFGAELDYAAIARYADHGRLIDEMRIGEIIGHLVHPVSKLIARHPSLSPSDVLAAVRALSLSGFEASLSGAPFVEIVQSGVNKGAALIQFARTLGIERADVLAFGDAPNDVTMLSWAGWGVAVANAAPETLAVADEVTLSNVEDGVAVVIERLLSTKQEPAQSFAIM